MPNINAKWNHGWYVLTLLAFTLAVSPPARAADDMAEDDGGIFGGAFHLLGEVLAFPFRLIGDAFDYIF